MHTKRIQGHRIFTPHATAWLKPHGASSRLTQPSISGNARGTLGFGTTSVRFGTCGSYRVQGATPFEQHILNEWIGAHVSTTGGHTELDDGYEEGEDGTWKVQDHNAQNEVLKSFTLRRTSVFIQSGLRDEELGRVAISCHYAVDCPMGEGGTVWSTRKSFRRRCKQHEPARYPAQPGTVLSQRTRGLLGGGQSA